MEIATVGTTDQLSEVAVGRWVVCSEVRIGMSTLAKCSNSSVESARVAMKTTVSLSAISTRMFCACNFFSISTPDAPN